MQKLLIKKIFFALLFLSPFVAAKGMTFFEDEKLGESSVEKYLQLHRKFSNEVCTPGVEQEFWKKNKAFRGNGFFLPMLPDGTLDKETVIQHIPDLKKKAAWIDQQIKFLKKTKSFAPLIQEVTELQKNLAKLLDLKQAHHEEENALTKRKAAITSKYALLSYQVKVQDFLKKIPFLLSYRFPVDHFELRKRYDEFKNSLDKDEKRQANSIYFTRMIVQDGALDPNRTRSDEFLRSMLDTISLELTKSEGPIISEDLRYDLNSALEMLKNLLSRGVSQNLIRMQEWKERTLRATVYYTSLISDKVPVAGKFETAQEVSAQKVQARYELRDFNFKKQAKVYHFWKDQDELMRALFSIETILYNEVGGLDSKHALEKKDITQIVLNRFHHDFYSSLTATDGLHSYLEIPQEEINKFSWLNLLFKTGEFSFTYYFIPSSVRVYCPEMTRSGRWLRKHNLEVALELLKSPRPEFRAYRYYSRHSMQGRMRMDRLWKNYRAINERPGVEIGDDKALQKSLKLKSYQYLYTFTSPEGQSYNVIEVAGDIYSYNPKLNKFYTWRNPHYFRYFEPID